MLGLGEPVDRPISQYEEMFLPLSFREHIRSVRVPGPEGTVVPLVRSERTVFLSTRDAPRETPPAWLPWYLAIGIVTGGLLVYAGGRSRYRRGARGALVLGGVVWGLLNGILGLVLFGLWAFTDHATSYANENLFQFSPLALALVIMVPLAVLGRQRGARAARRLTGLLVLLGIAGILFKLVPGGIRQDNSELIALALPINIGLWFALGLSAGRPSAAASVSPRVEAPAKAA